jgi:superfamily II DNA/RNA helicase
MSKLPNSYKDWIIVIQSFSKKYLKYGSFLPAQECLLKQLYDSLYLYKEKVVSFTAPPASGKTHVITLCAAYLNRNGFKTCIITPNNELMLDFNNEFKDITVNASATVPVMSINTFKKHRNNIDYALMDEAHNLRSAIELDNSVVKTFRFQEPDDLFHFLAAGSSSSKYVVKELNIETASDALRKMLKSENKRTTNYILRTITQWRAFCVIFNGVCDLKFFLVDPKLRNLLPKGRLFLFSATRLDEEELHFYCDIPKESLRTIGEKETKFIPKSNVQYHYVDCKTVEAKIDLAINLLKKTASHALILLNNNRTCTNWHESLSKALKNRIVLVGSGMKYSDRVNAFKQFAQNPEKILLTSSNVYWEGITIKDLTLLIIPNIPFPQPTLLELAEGRRPKYKKIAERRLIQGIGRIGRVPHVNGRCLLLFNPPKSFNYIQKSSIEQVLSS